MNVLKSALLLNGYSNNMKRPLRLTKHKTQNRETGRKETHCDNISTVREKNFRQSRTSTGKDNIETTLIAHKMINKILTNAKTKINRGVYEIPPGTATKPTSVQPTRSM